MTIQYTIYLYLICIAPCFAIFQCVFNVYSMCIQCVFNVHSMYIQYIFNIHSIYIQCLAMYSLFALVITPLLTYLLTDSHTPNLEMLSHLKSQQVTPRPFPPSEAAKIAL